MSVEVSYTIWVYDAAGVPLANVDDFTEESGSSFTCTRSVNTPGVLVLNLPGKYLALFNKPSRWLDYRIGVWRRIGKGPEVLDTDTIYFVRKVRRIRRKGVLSLVVTAYSAMELLKRRIVEADAGDAAASKTDQIDDMMKAVVREQLGSLAAGIRNISTYLSVEADLSLGTSTTKVFSRDNVLAVLQDLAKEAGTTAVPLFFDIVAPSISTLEFRVKRHQWGKNRTVSGGGNNAVTLSADDDTLTDVQVEDDYTDEVNYVYVGGSGLGSNRAVEPVNDPARYAVSPLNLREEFTSYTNSNVQAALQSVGYAALREGRPRKVMTATLQSNDSAQYGVHWNYGDKLTVQDGADTFDARVDSVTIAMQAGRESARAALRSES